MAAPNSVRIATGDPPALHMRAMDNLEFIRDTMERASAFTAVSGLGMGAVGVVALFAAWTAHLVGSPTRAVVVWVLAAAIGGVVSVAAIAVKARSAGLPLLSGPGRKLLLAFLPAMLAGAALTVVLTVQGQTGILPGTWLLLYGAAVIAGGAFSVRIIPVMGVCFMILGFSALIAPVAAGTLFMALGFGGLHLIFGVLIARSHGG